MSILKNIINVVSGLFSRTTSTVDPYENAPQALSDETLIIRWLGCFRNHNRFSNADMLRYEFNQTERHEVAAEWFEDWNEGSRIWTDVGLLCDPRGCVAAYPTNVGSWYEADGHIRGLYEEGKEKYANMPRECFIRRGMFNGIIVHERVYRDNEQMEEIRAIADINNVPIYIWICQRHDGNRNGILIPETEYRQYRNAA